jgi:putative beta-lysine N-acetyltransferase
MVQERRPLPSPTDPRPRWRIVTLTLPSRERVTLKDDSYSDRIRCDHPQTTDGERLGTALLAAAAERGRGRVVVLAPESLGAGLASAGFYREAIMPGFYEGRLDCHVMGAAPDARRRRPSNTIETRRVDDLLRRPRPAGRVHEQVPTHRATGEDAPAIARLIADCFEYYPTPSGVPDFIATEIGDGTVFRIVRDGDRVVACASADLVESARTAELTDCATHPDHRGRGLMQFILADLAADLRAMRYPTAFTLSRASVPGINLAFQRLGFAWRGRMIRSCRIGEGLEDMNVWSRKLGRCDDDVFAVPFGRALIP